MSTVVRFETQPTSSRMLLYTCARLSCGHVGSVATKPYRGKCWSCDTDQELPKGSGTVCACGSTSFVITYSPRAEVATDRITQIGDEVACETCADHARQLAWLEALDASTVFRARYSERWNGQYHFYRREPSSPSGVMLIGTVDATPAIDALLRTKRISPLSPSEGRER